MKFTIIDLLFISFLTIFICIVIYLSVTFLFAAWSDRQKAEKNREMEQEVNTYYYNILNFQLFLLVNIMFIYILIYYIVHDVNFLNRKDNMYLMKISDLQKEINNLKKNMKKRKKKLF